MVKAQRVGDTVVADTTVLRVHGARAALLETDLLRFNHLGYERTAEQDPKYPIRLLVDIAIRALSPAVNDPTTAVQAIDQIEDLLHRLGRRELDAGYVRDAEGVLRLVFPMPTWNDYLTLAFHEIRPVWSQLDTGHASAEGSTRGPRGVCDARSAWRCDACISDAAGRRDRACNP
jgi:uncharacterized membrane protein